MLFETMSQQKEEQSMTDDTMTDDTKGFSEPAPLDIPLAHQEAFADAIRPLAHREAIAAVMEGREPRLPGDGNFGVICRALASSAKQGFVAPNEADDGPATILGGAYGMAVRRALGIHTEAEARRLTENDVAGLAGLFEPAYRDAFDREKARHDDRMRAVGSLPAAWSKYLTEVRRALKAGEALHELLRLAQPHDCRVPILNYLREYVEGQDRNAKAG